MLSNTQNKSGKAKPIYNVGLAANGLIKLMFNYLKSKIKIFH